MYSTFENFLYFNLLVFVLSIFQIYFPTPFYLQTDSLLLLFISSVPYVYIQIWSRVL
jgi:hypothetical protein